MESLSLLMRGFENEAGRLKVGSEAHIQRYRYLVTHP